MRETAYFTLERLLDEVLYKDHLQDLLVEYGESPSGQKPELVERFLNSDMVHKKEVSTIVREILEQVPVADLRNLGRGLNIKMPSSKEEMVRHLMKKVCFEPYVRMMERDCPVCKVKTIHDLHFKSDWRASYFRCRTCNNRVDVDVVAAASVEQAATHIESGNPGRKIAEMSPETALTLKMTENTAPTISMIAEQQSSTAATMKALESMRHSEELMRNHTLSSNQTLLNLEAMRIKESRASGEIIARKVDRGTLWTIAGILLALGVGIPSLLAAVLKMQNVLVLSLSAALFLIVGGFLIVRLLLTRKRL